MFNIAKNTFKEIVRNKFLYLIVFFAFVFITFSLVLARLTIGEPEKIIVDFGLSMIEIFGLIGVLFVGSQLLFKEVEGKTIFLILSKPIQRHEFILGKFFGFSATIFLITLVQAILYLGVLFVSSIEVSSLILWSLFFTFLKLEVLLAIVFFFSTFMGNMMTIMMSFLLYLIAHNFSMMLDLAYRIGSKAFLSFTQALQVVVPPLQAMNIKEYVGGIQSFSSLHFLMNTSYALVYIAFLLVASTIIFTKRNFED